jgi:hypothetical protein
MDTLTQPPDTDTDTTLYFLRCAAVLRAVELEKARRCLPPAA